MTGKEAAKRGWGAMIEAAKAASAKSATIFVVAGLAGLVLAHSFADMLSWVKDPAIAAAVLGFAQKALKKTGEDVTTQILKDVGALQADVKRGDREHSECMGRHDAVEHRVGTLEQAWGRIQGNPGMGS